MPFTIAHFSDVHITEDPQRIPWSGLLSKRFIGWINLRFGGRYPEFRDAPAITTALVDDLLAQSVDHYVFTGDISGLSLRSEFETARKILEPLLRTDRITGIPGNHDVYVRAAEREGVYRDLFGGWERSDRPDSPPIVRLLAPDVVLIALVDSRPTGLLDSSGKVGDEQMERLDRLLDDPAIKTRRRFLALHYAPRRRNRRPDARHHGLRDDDRLLEVIAGRVDVVLHGHLHDRFVLRIGDDLPVTVTNAGSATQTAHDRAYHLLRVEDHRITLSARRWDTDAGTFVQWPDAPGSGQL